MHVPPPSFAEKIEEQHQAKKKAVGTGINSTVFSQLGEIHNFKISKGGAARKKNIKKIDASVALPQLLAEHLGLLLGGVPTVAEKYTITLIE